MFLRSLLVQFEILFQFRLDSRVAYIKHSVLTSKGITKYFIYDTYYLHILRWHQKNLKPVSTV